MIGQQRSKGRTLAGLILAIFVAPAVTALCLNVALVLTMPVARMNILDVLGGALTFILLAVIFGGLLAAVPTLILGSITITIARCIGTRSPAFFAAAGLLAGLAMAWVDTRRTHSVFSMLEAMPFLVGGCSSALAYWFVAER